MGTSCRCHRRRRRRRQSIGFPGIHQTLDLSRVYGRKTIQRVVRGLVFNAKNEDANYNMVHGAIVAPAEVSAANEEPAATLPMLDCTAAASECFATPCAVKPSIDIIDSIMFPSMAQRIMAARSGIGDDGAVSCQLGARPQTAPHTRYTCCSR